MKSSKYGLRKNFILDADAITSFAKITSTSSKSEVIIFLQFLSTILGSKM
jgi:hypothetical protein